MKQFAHAVNVLYFTDKNNKGLFFFNRRSFVGRNQISLAIISSLFSFKLEYHENN